VEEIGNNFLSSLRCSHSLFPLNWNVSKAGLLNNSFNFGLYATSVIMFLSETENDGLFVSVQA
jgi:hypothetical protein